MSFFENYRLSHEGDSFCKRGLMAVGTLALVGVIGGVVFNRDYFAEKINYWRASPEERFERDVDFLGDRRDEILERICREYERVKSSEEN